MRNRGNREPGVEGGNVAIPLNPSESNESNNDNNYDNSDSLLNETKEGVYFDTDTMEDRVNVIPQKSSGSMAVDVGEYCASYADAYVASKAFELVRVLFM